MIYDRHSRIVNRPDTIQLIVGLANPGSEYAATRHNAGAWFVEQLAESLHTSLRLENKFHSLVGNVKIAGHSCWLLIPTTFMNHSGQAVKTFANYYQIPPENILVAHDELDFSPGIIKLKQGGGHAGHNGLRDIVAHLHNNNFYRLRLGIGHPGNRDQVTDYVLSRPNNSDRELIFQVIDKAIGLLPSLLAGKIQSVMQELHG